MGRLEIARITKRDAHKTALTASQILLYYPGFRPALIELAYLQAENGEWDLSMETCARLCLPMPHSDSRMNNFSYDAQFLQSAYELLVKGDLEKGRNLFKVMVDKMSGLESSQQALEASLLISRICQKDPT
jgi:hypothetical protein